MQPVMSKSAMKSGQVNASAGGSRINWVDYAKGICIILVVMMHSTLGVEKAAEATGWLGYVVEFSKPFRMPDFFLISGLFLGLVIDRSWLRYIDRKVVHFLYFYVLWLAIQFAFKAPGWMAEGDTAPMLLGKLALSFVEPFGTLWFIYMLPVFFIVTRLGKILPWWIMFGAAALLEILPIHTGWLMIDEFASRYVYFLSGYLFASKIFRIADWVDANKTKALACLALWMSINGLLVFAPVNPSFSAMAPAGFDFQSYSHLPLISLALGGLGAMAIICGSVLLSTFHWTRFLEYLGRNSIVIYLAFFLPMAISRAVLLKFATFLDVGTVSALVTLAGVVGPVMLYILIQYTGYGKFLFHRPQWAWIEGTSKARKAQLQAAE